MSTLSARGLTLKAGERTLASGLDLEIGPGDAVAVVGPSGSGKTTLLRALALLDEPAAGAVALDGVAPTNMPAFRRRVVYVQQRPTVLGGTVREELARPHKYASASAPFDEARAVALLSRFSVEGKLDQDATSLSEGERQRVCLARALLVDPAFLLLDEPTSALDADAASQVEAELESFREAGGGIVLVSHDEDQRARMSSSSVSLG